jgi:hypothetical protein
MNRNIYFSKRKSVYIWLLQALWRQNDWGIIRPNRSNNSLKVVSSEISGKGRRKIGWMRRTDELYKCR